MADVLVINQPAPDFALPAENGEQISLAQFRHRTPVLVFFYPGDFTPVCTAEVCAFRDDYHQFRKRSVTILGISSDRVERHKLFATECRVPFHLLSDEKMDVASRYGAKGLLGMRRSYYLIDRQGRLVWQHCEVLPIFKLSNQRILEVIDNLLKDTPSGVTEPSLTSGSPLPPHA